MGNDSTDVITFAGGLATTGNGTNPGTVNLAGTVQTEGAQIDLGAVTLATATTLKTDGNSATGDANINIGTVGVTSNDNLTITSTGTIDFQGTVNLGTGNLDVSLDTDNDGTETFVIDQTITAGSIDITGSGAAGGDTLDVDQNLAAGTSLTLDNLQTIAIAVDVDLSAASGDLSATTNVGSITLDGTAGENEIKTTGGTGNVNLSAIGNSGTASDLIVTTAAGTTSGDITLNGAVTGVGYVTINAGSTTSGNSGDVAINANLTAADANGGTGIDIDATNDVTVAGTLTTSDGGTALDIDIDAGNEFTLSSGGIDSDDDVFITATANDVNLAAGLTADNEVTIISTSGSVLQTAGNILATNDVNIDAAATSQKIDLAGTIGATTAIGGNVLIGQSVGTSDIEIDGAITADGSVVVDGATITATANISSDANTDTTGDVDLGATGTISQTGGSINANNGFAKIVSSGSTVSLVDVDSAGANTQATEITTNGIADNSGVAIQIQGAGDVTVGGIDATNAAGNVEIKSTANIVLNDVDGGATSGTVYLEAGDSITDANGNTVNISADNLNLVAVNDATLNTNVATLDFSGRAITISETDALDITASSATGALSITAGGPITQSGAIDADSTASFAAGANAITLANASNDFSGAVSLSNSGSNDVSLTDTNALDLGTVGVGQNLAITASGAITDSGVVTVAGTTTFDNSGGSNAAIELDSASTYTGNVTFTTDSGSDITITDNSAFAIQDGLNVNNLSITSTGSVTDLGDINIDGALTVSATDQAIDLSGGGSNDITGAVTLTGGAITLADSTATSIAAITATGALSVTSGGTITQSGAIDADSTASFSSGGNAITLNSEANDFTGAVSLTNTGANNVTIDDANDLILGTVSIAAGDLNVDNAGNISQTGVVSVGGNTVLDNSGGDNADITLANANNAFTGTVTFSTDTGSDISIADTTAFDLGALAVNSLIVSAGGDISDSGVLDIGTTASFTTTAANGNIGLDQASDIDGALSITTHGTGTSSVTNLTDAIELGAITSSQLTIGAAGDITNSGVLDIGGNAEFTTTGSSGSVSLDQASDIDGVLTVTTDGTGTTSVTNLTGSIDLGAITTAELTIDARGSHRVEHQRLVVHPASLQAQMRSLLIKQMSLLER